MRSSRSMLTAAAVLALLGASVPAGAEQLLRDAAAPAAPAAANSSPACAAPCQALPLLDKKALTISGSTTVRPVTERAQTFFQVDHKVAFTVLAPGSGAGRRALLEGQCARVGGFPSCDLNADMLIDAPVDIAESSSPMPAGERTFAANHGCCLVEYSVAVDGLGIIVNTANTGLDAGGLLGGPPTNQVRSIFNGTVTDYALVGGTPGTIHVYSRQPPSGTYDSFTTLYSIPPGELNPATDSCPGNVPAAGCVVFLGSNDEIAAAVGANPQGIGYVGVGFLGANPSIKSVKVRKTVADTAVAASFDTVQNGTFAFTRKLFYYLCGVPSASDHRGEFIDFVESRTGQAIVAETGFVPSYVLNPVADNQQSLLEPSIAEVLRIDADRIQDVEAFLAGGGGTAAEIAEAKSFLHEQFAGDRTIVGNIVNRAVACGADAAHAAQALAAFNAGVTAGTANPADYVTANTEFQTALRLAQQALR